MEITATDHDAALAPPPHHAQVMPRLGPVLVALTLLAACNGGGTEGPDEAWSLNGTWRGGFVGENANMSAVLTLSEQDTIIGGSGFISGSGIECEVAIEGRRTGERIRFDILCLEFPPIRFRGNRVSSHRIEGVVGGSGIVPNTMELIKQ